jgi:hypothetical protein
MALNVHDRAARELGNHRAELLFELMDIHFDQHGPGILQRLGSGVADLVELRKAGFLRDEVPGIAFNREAARPAHVRELILLLRKDRIAHFVARQREIRRADGADRARGIADDCDFRHATAPLVRPSFRSGGHWIESAPVVAIFLARSATFWAQKLLFPQSASRPLHQIREQRDALYGHTRGRRR